MSGTGKRSRSLSDEESKLWEVVARAVKPLRKRAPKKVEAKAAPTAEKVVAEKPKRIKLSAPLVAKPPLPVQPKSKPGPSPLDRRTKQKLGRGRESIDARLDLHGMTQAEAYTALSYFLRRVQSDGARFVIVVTGKGARGAEGSERGVLRRQVPQWLGLPEFRELVVGFDVAGIGHGGEGALYVQVRRIR